MELLKARSKRKEILASIKRNVDADLYLDLGDTPKKRKENIPRLGYLKAVDKDGEEYFFSFDINEDGSARIGNKDPKEFNTVLEERRATSDFYKKKIDFDLLNRIKSSNRGPVINIPNTSDMLDEITSRYKVSKEAIDALRNLIRREKETLYSYNRATHISMSLNCADNGFQIGFAANCEAIKQKNEYNWHLQNISQWLYAGCIQGLVHDGIISEVSSHH